MVQLVQNCIFATQIIVLVWADGRQADNNKNKRQNNEDRHLNAEFLERFVSENVLVK